MTHDLSLDRLKLQAKNLRQSLADQGHSISHSQSLELLAKQMGHRDWNILHASIGNQPAPAWQVHPRRVTGRYLGHRFAGQVTALREMADGKHFGLTVRFDTPIDVVEFDSMSNFRQQVNAVVDRSGRTVEKTSDGQPHLVLDM